MGLPRSPFPLLAVASVPVYRVRHGLETYGERLIRGLGRYYLTELTGIRHLLTRPSGSLAYNDLDPPSRLDIV